MPTEPLGNDVVVMYSGALTTRGWGDDALGAKLASPEYVAVIACWPAPSDAATSDAVPVCGSTIACPMGVAPSSNSTTPVGAPGLPSVTVADIVSGAPNTAVGGTVAEVVVGARAPTAAQVSVMVNPTCGGGTASVGVDDGVHPGAVAVTWYSPASTSHPNWPPERVASGFVRLAGDMTALPLGTGVNGPWRDGPWLSVTLMPPAGTGAVWPSVTITTPLGSIQPPPPSDVPPPLPPLPPPPGNGMPPGSTSGADSAPTPRKHVSRPAAAAMRASHPWRST